MADIENIRKLSLELHALVHPSEVSGRKDKTIADYILDYMLSGNQNKLVSRQTYPVDLHYAGTMISVGKNTRKILENLTLEQINSMVPEEWVMRVLEEGGVTTDFRSVWLLVFWGRLTIAQMILTPLTDHHMMHLPTCLESLPILN